MKTPNTDQLRAIHRFAIIHGRTWKSTLAGMWMNGKDLYQVDGDLLRQVRNQFGPGWLQKFKLGERAA